MGGIAGTYYTDSQTAYLEPAVLKGLILKYPDIRSLSIVLAMSKKNNMGVFAPDHYWFECDNVARITTIPVGGSAADVSLGVTVGDGWKVQIYTQLRVPRTGEIMRVTAISTDTMTVTRSWGTTAAADLISGEPIQILGKAYPQGAQRQTDGVAANDQKYTRLQIFRNGWDATGTAISTQTYGKKDIFLENKQKQFIQHYADQDTAFMFGEVQSSGSGATSVRTTTSLTEVITSNVMDFNGTMSELAFQNAIRPIYETGSPDKVFVGSGLCCDVISNYSTNKLQTSVGQTEYGNRINKYKYGSGDLTVVPSRLALRGPDQDKFFIIDKDNFHRVYLNGNGKSRDTFMKEYNMENTEYDARRGELICEAGVEIHIEESHFRGYGVTG